MSIHKKLMTVCCAAVLAFGLAACGSSSDDNDMPVMTDGDMPDGTMPVTVDLTNVTDGTTAEAGTLDIEAGMSGKSGNTAFACAAGGDDCTVTVTVDDDDTVTATSTGGMVMAGQAVEVDPAIGQREAISSAITAANIAVGVVTDAATDGEVAAADMAIATAKMAIADAANVPAEEAAANSGTVSVLETALANAKTSRTTAMNAADEGERKAMAAAGKALHGAMGTDPLNFLDADNAVSLGSSGLTVNPNGDTDDDAAGGLAAVTLEAGDDAGALGSWNGKHYIHTDAGSKVLNHAVVWTNQGAPMSTPIGEEHPLTTEGSLVVADTDPARALVKADAFMHSGTQTHAVPDRAKAVYVGGTYDGAEGEYSCEMGCSSTNDGSGSPSGLGGIWTFTPKMGATVSQPDTGLTCTTAGGSARTRTICRRRRAPLLAWSWWERETAPEAYLAQPSPVARPIAAGQPGSSRSTTRLAGATPATSRLTLL